MKSILYIGNKLSHHGFTPGGIETLGWQLESEGFKVYYAGTLRNKFLRLWQIVYRTIVFGTKVNYILIDTYSTSAFWYAYIAGRIAEFEKSKYIPILRGGDLPSRLKRSKWACDRLFGSSYTNVAVSGYLQSEFKKYGYQVTLVPNNIEISNYSFKLREHPQPKILWVRAFSKEYNANMATDVLVKLQVKYPGVSLCMVGPDRDGSLSEFIKYAENKGVSGRIKITGKLTKQEWIKASGEYDFFINTTNVDNTPVSVIEAMALGLVVISTDPGGIPFLLTRDKDSKLVRIGDASAMATAIDYLIENPTEAVRLSLAARLKAETFSSEKIMDLWVKLLS